MERWFPIETERLLLREFALPDEPDIHEFACDPIVSRYDSWGPNTSAKTHDVLMRRMAEQQTWPRNDVTLAAVLTRERRLIGSVHIWTMDEANCTAEIGYTFNRRYWNNGYATEAASAVLGRAFRDVKMHRVVAKCDARNVGSWRVMEKLGMRREGHFLQDTLQKGEWRNTYLYAILADEWMKGHT